MKLLKHLRAITYFLLTRMGLMIGIVMLLVLIVILNIFGPSLFEADQIALLEKPTTYRPIAKDMAVFCQSFGTSVGSSGCLNKEMLPDSAQTLKWDCIWESEDGVTLYCGNRPYHYGYVLERDDSLSTPSGTVWHLYFHRDGQRPNIELELVRIPAKDKFSNDDLVRWTNQHFINELSSNPGSVGLYQRNISFLLQYASIKVAINRLKEAIFKTPDLWWPRFMLDLLTFESKTSIGEGNTFSHWVASHPNYTNYANLVWLDKLKEDTPDAIDAAQSMIKYTSTEDNKTDDWRDRDLAIATYMAQLHRPDLAGKVCYRYSELNKVDDDDSSKSSESRDVYVMKEWTRHILGRDFFGKDTAEVLEIK